MSFQALMDELDVLAKSQAAADGAEGDQKIAAAAAEGQAAGDAGTEGGTADGGDAGAAGAEGAAAAGEGKPEGESAMGKSFAMTLEDGTVVEAIDGTDLVKALMERVENQEGQMAKALGQAVGLIRSQGEMLKSLQDQVKTLSGEGRGRKTVVSIAEKPGVMTKSHQEPEGIPATEFMAKALAAQAAGKITGADVSRAEAYINRGIPVPQEIVARVAQ